jgi:hypothetical protein
MSLLACDENYPIAVNPFVKDGQPLAGQGGDDSIPAIGNDSAGDEGGFRCQAGYQGGRQLHNSFGQDVSQNQISASGPKMRCRNRPFLDIDDSLHLVKNDVFPGDSHSQWVRVDGQDA